MLKGANGIARKVAIAIFCCFLSSGCWAEISSDSLEARWQATADELEKMLGEKRATIMAGGHSHVQMLRQHHGLWLLNVGSVGMPFEQMPFKGAPRFLPWAEYAIIEVKNGRLHAQTFRWEKAAKQTLKIYEQVMSE